MIKKALITIVGGLLTLAGAALIILPGPAWLLLPIGLAILSLEYTWARRWLKKSQAYLSKTARWLDRKLLLRRLSGK
ncbi:MULTISPECIES: PGPGW domain-containing protein [Shewanella]|uniref:PGPGW domain-containing protein n=1 Tax=Shewanella fidelis TaxID=173509 RepID=A0AAW8NM60_9GAMM|nr:MULTISPECIES: PGPGW domain-containing protein [Shewanella]MDR8523626.1 PGPGW domain-containing protein [Shewanella fidelis]MDW4810173.1 PGPGW domain-containing protein [Shewanella fidelis]MDW4814318.1 PGPGW domain-containing protein [Shewanella fidelis]MDW4818409.1 PGPGW domain-containing protein [Shewanella fidelis]MDW4823939.1 PGPGW domain-containing protein [Shewanella fidelis]